MHRVIFWMAAVWLMGTSGGSALAGSSFSDLVGDVEVGDVQSTSPLSVPYITWGGDMATFFGNGGTKTTPGSIFAEQGLDLELVAGDDFPPIPMRAAVTIPIRLVDAVLGLPHPPAVDIAYGERLGPWIRRERSQQLTVCVAAQATVSPLTQPDKT